MAVSEVVVRLPMRWKVGKRLDGNRARGRFVLTIVRAAIQRREDPPPAASEPLLFPACNLD